MSSTTSVCVPGTRLAQRGGRISEKRNLRIRLSCSESKAGGSFGVLWKAPSTLDRRLYGISAAFAAEFKSISKLGDSPNREGGWVLHNYLASRNSILL